MEKSEIKHVLEELKLSVKFTFVPYSQTEGAVKKPAVSDLSINYKAGVYCGEKLIFSTPYRMGVAHCPSYVQKWGKGATVNEHKAITYECEKGFTATDFNMNYGGNPTGKAILPDTIDFFYCISSDTDVFYRSGFEDWAENYGYDTDSRKAEKIYNECLKQALALRACIGESGMGMLRGAYEDY